jgi:undecaprenyl-phosphate 4-deoxy-4-formamido-L-arabinose transferase
VGNEGISIVIPVYNGHQTLVELVERLIKVLEELPSEFEIILVNDGSKDSSWQVICELTDRYAFATGMDLMRNYGQHNALLAGIRTAKHEIIVTIDDDLQHPPEEIPKLIAKLNEGYDVVYGSAEEKPHGFLRNIASQTTKLALQSFMNIKVAQRTSAFRIFRTSLRNAFENYDAPRSSIDALLSWGTTRFSFVEVKHNQREIGKSNYTFLKLVAHAINMTTGFSTLPLRAASLIGFAFTIFGFFVLAYVVGRYLISGTPVPGFPFLASIISVFAGVQLFALGVIGEYVGQIHSRALRQPSYQIRQTTNNETAR